jgi:cysteine desulfurase family protein (TIGR01976 family)
MLDASLIPATAPDLAGVRQYFPSLEQQINGQPVVFLDNPGGTDLIIQEARAALADFLNCAAHEIVFGPNMTTLTFAISRALGRELHAGDEIVVTTLDHDANIAPWRAIAAERDLVVRQVAIDPATCTLDMDDLQAKITDRTKLVAVGYASNAVGTINDVATITRLAHTAGALVWIDAVQYAPHGPIDVQALDCDFLICSAYKFFGPHLGILYGKTEHLARLQPYKVRPASDAVPERFETGTQTHELLAGLLGTMDYLTLVGNAFANPAPDVAQGYTGRRRTLKIAMGAILAYERTLSQYLLTLLGGIRGLKVYGLAAPTQVDRRVPTVALTMPNHSPRDLAGRLASAGICAWDGNYYALELMERLGLEATGGALRLGLAHYNTTAEIDRCVQVLSEAARA